MSKKEKAKLIKQTKLNNESARAFNLEKLENDWRDFERDYYRLMKHFSDSMRMVHERMGVVFPHIYETKRIGKAVKK